MQTVEDILYTCYEEGIKDEVMACAAELSKLPKYKNRPAADIYHDAYLEVKRDKDIRLWESALIKATEYFPSKEELIVEFNNGSRYKYKEFSKELYDSFLNAESKGQFFLSEVRKKYMNSENMEKL